VLHVTADTVKHHVTAVMTKLDMSNRTQVAAWVLQQEVDLDAAEEAS
jgi:DNA-binding NarL/FixJ family response regulator